MANGVGAIPARPVTPPATVRLLKGKDSPEEKTPLPSGAIASSAVRSTESIAPPIRIGDVVAAPSTSSDQKLMTRKEQEAAWTKEVLARHKVLWKIKATHIISFVNSAARGDLDSLRESVAFVEEMAGKYAPGEDKKWWVAFFVNTPAIGIGNPNTTALHASSRNGESDVVKFLIECGADVNLDVLGKTALQEATHTPNFETITLLVHSGADKTAIAYGKYTAYDLAIKYERTKDDAVLSLLKP